MALLIMDWWWTCAELSCEVGIALSTIHATITIKLKMWKICTRCVPHNLTRVSDVARWGNCQIALDHYACEGEAFLRWILTMDKTQACPYQPEESQVNGITKGQNARGNFNRSRVKSGSHWLMPTITRAFSWHTVPSGSMVNIGNYWKIIWALKCIITNHIFWSQSPLCCTTLGGM
jgi:hypothetical protein